MIAKGKRDQWWEMLEGGPYDKDSAQEIFKCTGCGAVSRPEAGWNGEPDRHVCHSGCPCSGSDWKIGRQGRTYRENFDRIFPHAPGAGL